MSKPKFRISHLRILPKNFTHEMAKAAVRLVMHFTGEANTTDENYKRFDDLIRINNLDLAGLFERISPPCSSMLQKCLWKVSKIHSCKL